MTLKTAAAPLQFVLLLIGLCIPISASADETVDITARFFPSEGKTGEHTVLEIQFDIPTDFHLYSMTRITDGPLPLKIEFDSQQPNLTPITKWHGDPPTIQHDSNFNKPVEFYATQATLTRGFKIGRLPARDLTYQVKIKGQICDDEKCIPFRKTATATLTVEAGPPRTDRSQVPKLSGEIFSSERPAPTAADITPNTANNAPPMGAGFWSFVLIAFLAGLGALVTPCVFPMIPITVSFFSKFAKVSIRRSVTMGGVYAGSIVVTFTLLGVLISALFGAVGMQTLSASALFNIFLTLLLVVFAFNLFGLFEIQMPSWLVSKTSEKERSLSGDDGSILTQAAGVFFMAVTFTLVSFTCTVGFIGVVLAEAAKGNWFYPAVGMLAFSLAFSLPFFVLAVFPSIADKIRGKGGDWMVAVKVVLGFLELAGAFKFLSNVDLLWQWGVITRPFVLAVWAALFGGAALYLLRIFNLPHSNTDTRHVGPIRMMTAILLLALAVYSASGIRDTKSMGGWLDGWLPPARYPGQEIQSPSDESHLNWIENDISRGMREAKAAKKPLFIDFTGYTCTNCRYMEGAVFPKPAVESRLKKMVRVSAYTDCEQAVCEAQRTLQLERFQTAALPFYAIIDPFDDAVLATHPDMTKNVDSYIRFLDEGIDAFTKKEAGRLAQNPTTPKKSPDIADAGTNAVSLIQSALPIDFTLPELESNRKRQLLEYRGSWVFLNFWASWCAPCKKEIEHVFPVALKTAPHIKLVTVAFDGEETRDAALAFAKKNGLLRHTALLGGEEIGEAPLPESLKTAENLPVSFLIHPKGHIAWRHEGSVDSAMLTTLFAAASPTTK